MKLLRDNTRLCLLLVVILRGPQVCAQVGAATFKWDGHGPLVRTKTKQLVCEREILCAAQKFVQRLAAGVVTTNE